jgi:exonuclease VII large subunit
MDWQPIDTAIWSWLFLVKQKYDEKNERLKKRTKEFDKKQKNYCENLEKRRKDKEHYQEHIKRAETKLCEYKNTILAFGKLATCNSISK